MKKATAPPPEQKPRNSGRVGAAKGFKSKEIKDPSLRRRPIEADIYGEELLRPNFKKEKEIVICFYPFTRNNYRISTDGKFIIERVEVGNILVPENITVEEGIFPGLRWTLLYFKQPITNFTPPEDLNKIKEMVYCPDLSLCTTFEDFFSVKDLSDKVIELVREEYFQEKQERIAKLFEQDKKYAEDLEKLKEEEENAKQTNDS